MNLRKVNLNLLIALDALLRECHVTKAAEKIYLSQSAMSNSLKQLRELFGDELLVRGQAGNMTLTNKAKELREPIAESLRHIKAVFEEDVFKLEECDSIFTLGMSDYVATVICPQLLATIQKKAPKIQLIIKHINSQNYVAMIENNQVDLAIGFFQPTHQNLMCQRLYSDRLVCLADKNHPAFRNDASPTLKQFISYPHILISHKDDPSMDFSEIIIKKLGKKREIPMTMPYSIVSLVLLQNTEYITILPERFVELFERRRNFVRSQVPFKIPSIQISQLWHRRFQTDPLHKWIRQQIKSICTDIETRE